MAAVNRVDYGGETLISLISDTVTKDKVIKGVTFHAANGETMVGTLDLSEYLKIVDVVNNLTSTVTNKPLSAYQGKVLNDTKEPLQPMIKGTLSKGSTSITLSSSYIKTTSALSTYTSIYGVSPKSVSVSAGKAILTFDAQTSNMDVAIKIEG